MIGGLHYVNGQNNATKLVENTSYIQEKKEVIYRFQEGKLRWNWCQIIGFYLQYQLSFY
ncbi:hypothetical protein QFZ80_001482 [Paenibacillus sp. V4I7]|nr:hypothetical protein [Paenibacillus sp. V4I7]MDQ0916339.1 hypothetical protein [Paenibacillus sp. V4I5]